MAIYLSPPSFSSMWMTSKTALHRCGAKVPGFSWTPWVRILIFSVPTRRGNSRPEGELMGGLWGAVDLAYEWILCFVVGLMMVDDYSGHNLFWFWLKSLIISCIFLAGHIRAVDYVVSMFVHGYSTHAVHPNKSSTTGFPRPAVTFCPASPSVWSLPSTWHRSKGLPVNWCLGCMLVDSKMYV